MAGRPKNPNKPPATRSVRITERTWNKMCALHVFGEPYGNTLERAIDEANYYRKKGVALQMRIEGLQDDLKTQSLAFDRLYNVHTETKKQLQIGDFQ
jgi:hypothetical protein